MRMTMMSMVALHVAVDTLTATSKGAIVYILCHEYNVGDDKVHGGVGGCGLLIASEETSHDVASVSL